jgi:hypothetical protein
MTETETNKEPMTEDQYQALLDKARATKAAFDEERARTGRWVVGKDGWSNWDHWHKAAAELAVVVLKREWASKSGGSVAEPRPYHETAAAQRGED